MRTMQLHSTHSSPSALQCKCVVIDVSVHGCQYARWERPSGSMRRPDEARQCRTGGPSEPLARRSSALARSTRARRSVARGSRFLIRWRVFLPSRRPCRAGRLVVSGGFRGGPVETGTGAPAFLITVVGDLAQAGPVLTAIPFILSRRTSNGRPRQRLFPRAGRMRGWRYFRALRPPMADVSQ